MAGEEAGMAGVHELQGGMQTGQLTWIPVELS